MASTTTVTAGEVMDRVAVLMNDPAKTDYTYAAMLPYYNIAMDELIENMEESNIGVSNVSSVGRWSMLLPVGKNKLTPEQHSETPHYPVDLVEIQEVSERLAGVVPPVVTMASNATAGSPGSWLPSGSSVPPDTSFMYAVAATPSTAWTAGQHMVLANGQHVWWNGTTWALGEGVTPSPLPTGAIGAISGGTWIPSNAIVPKNLSEMSGIIATPSSAWSDGKYMMLAVGLQTCWWTGSVWANGTAVGPVIFAAAADPTLTAGSPTNPFIPMVRREFMDPFPPGNALRFWSWENQIIKFNPLGALTHREIQLKYISNSFGLATNENTAAQIINSRSFLSYKTAALCAMFIGENETRASVLDVQAERALERMLGINNKGKQQIMTRHRPFRAGWKSRGGY